MPAARVNLSIEQGAKWRQDLLWKDGNGDPVDLTPYTARMQIRKRIKSATVTKELTSTDGEITLGGADGTIALELGASDTAEIAGGTYVYDLELVPGDADDVVRLAKGRVVVDPEVTR